MNIETSSSDGLIDDQATEWNLVRVFRGGVGLCSFLALWWLASTLTSPSYLLPGPQAAAQAIIEQFRLQAAATLPVIGTEVTGPRLLIKLTQSLLHYVPGVLVGMSAGIALGITVGWSTILDDALTPVIRLLRPIPPLAWIVFAIVWLGIGHVGAAFIVFIGAFWINFYGAYSGVESAPTLLREVGSNLGITNDLEMIRYVVLPSALPQLLTSARTSIGRCWMIVVGAELFGAPGVGYEIINASNSLAMDTSVAYMLVISAVFLLTDGVFSRFERRLLAWRA